MSNNDFPIWILFGLLAGITFGFFVFFQIPKKEFRTNAIEHGYAQYCPMDGKWAWKGECK